MKILYLSVIVGIVIATAIGVSIMATGIFGGVAPSSSNHGYIEIDPQGLSKTYEIGQAIHFSILIQGFGEYLCIPPNIVIYNNDDKGKPIFSYAGQSVTCPDPSEHYHLYFSAQNSTFSTVINQTGNYTLDVSLGKENSYQKQFSVIPSNHDVSKHRPPDVFSISVNGHSESTYVTTIKRGQTVQLDVYVEPKLSGITGNVSFENFGIDCTDYNMPRCTPHGVTGTFSTNTVTKPTHLILTLNVPSDFPTGIYTEEVIASTTISEPYQSRPFNDGDIDSFHIQVIQ